MLRSLLIGCAVAFLAWIPGLIAEEKSGNATYEKAPSETGKSSSGAVTLATAHYNLYVEGIDAHEVGRLLEAAHPQFTAFFGKSPVERLRFEVWSNQERYRAAVLRQAEGEETNGVEAAGCYLTSTRTAYMWPQSTEFLTRKTILHEAAHQFHFITGTTNVRPRLTAYPEGLAEYFAVHTWNGRVLNMGVVPRLAAPDYPSIALENFRTKHQSDFKGLMTGKRHGEYADYWAAALFLLSEHRQQAARWMARLDESTATFAQTHPLIAWNSIFGPKSAEMAESFEQWLSSKQQPWRVASGNWEDSGREIVGRSRAPKLSIATLKNTPSKLQVLIPDLKGEESAGLITNFEPDSSYQLLRLRATGELTLIEARPGEWVATKQWTLPDRASHLFTMAFNDGEVAVSHEEQELFRLNQRAAPGIFVEDGELKFVVTIESVFSSAQERPKG